MTVDANALHCFADADVDLAEHAELAALTSRGIVPLWTTIPPRTDLAEAAEWVPIYNEVIRGVAQAAQTPLMDLHGALQDVDGYGLSGDGVHLDADVDQHLLDATASPEGCVQRDNRLPDAELEPGTWWLVVDSFVSGTAVQSGDYVLVLVADPA